MMSARDEMTMPDGLSEAAAHHWQHGGWSYDPKTEGPAAGRLRCAVQAARDESELLRYMGAGFVAVEIERDRWPEDGDADPEVLADMLDGLQSGRYVYVETSIRDAGGDILAVLGGTCTDADEMPGHADALPGGYLRTVVVDLWHEAREQLRQAQGWTARTGEPDVATCTCATSTDDDGRKLAPVWMSCGTCGFVWCDRCNPVPGARTPCEHEHADPEPDPVDIVAEIGKRSGYGTLGHLVGVIVNDREDPALTSIDQGALVALVVDRADDLWNYIIGPALDRLTDAISEEDEG